MKPTYKQNCNFSQAFVNFIAIPGYDCPAFEDFYKCLTMVAGGTLYAVECLNNMSHSIAINWSGGWHHAHRCSISFPLKKCDKLKICGIQQFLINLLFSEMRLLDFVMLMILFWVF